MIRPDQIPDEVVKAALLTDERLGMREVISAALNAWPGEAKGFTSAWWGQEFLMLPLPIKEGEAPRQPRLTPEGEYR